MKPIDWDKMSKEEKRQFGAKLMNSPRGIYIISQALHYGIKSLNSVEPKIMRERSNIEDMEMLRECFFNFPIIDPEEQRAMIERLKSEKRPTGEADDKT